MLSELFRRLTNDRFFQAAAQQQSKHVPFDPFINAADEPAQPSAAHAKPKTHGVPAPSTTATTALLPPPKAEPISASPTTIKTFRKLFRADARGAIPWTAFTAAMTNVGFTIESIGGSIARFVPPAGGSPICLHRPHPTDKLEGWALLRVARRLKRSFGWGPDTFVPAKR